MEKMSICEPPTVIHHISPYPSGRLAEWIEQGKAAVEDELGKQLYSKLITGKAETLQEKQGKSAARYFRKLVGEKLKLDEKKKLGKVFLWAADGRVWMGGTVPDIPEYTKIL